MKQRHIFLSCLAIGAPWVVMLIKDDPLMALITLVLQASVIGWLPATIWAWQSIHSKKPQPTPDITTTVNNASNTNPLKKKST